MYGKGNKGKKRPADGPLDDGDYSARGGDARVGEASADMEREASEAAEVGVVTETAHGPRKGQPSTTRVSTGNNAGATEDREGQKSALELPPCADEACKPAYEISMQHGPESPNII